MPLTFKQVAQIARLARLNLSAAELEQYRHQLSAILDHFAQLSELDTSGIEPMNWFSGDANRLREDSPRAGLGRDELQDAAPDWFEDQFRVPPVFDRGDPG